MKKSVYFCLCFSFLASCNTNDKTSQDASIKVQAIDKNIVEANSEGADPVITRSTTANSGVDLKQRMLGAWTDGTSENASFDIKENSIFYVDQGEEYKYSLEKDVIRIQFPDYSYAAQVSFSADTLVLNSEEYGESKFWRFKP